LVKISFKPYQGLIILGHQWFVLEDAIRHRCTGVEIGSTRPSFQWADWLVMRRETSPRNEVITKENLDGRAHWLWAGHS
jgi:hypothetical protein